MLLHARRFYFFKSRNHLSSCIMALLLLLKSSTIVLNLESFRRIINRFFYSFCSVLLLYFFFFVLSHFVFIVFVSFLLFSYVRLPFQFSRPRPSLPSSLLFPIGYNSTITKLITRCVYTLQRHYLKEIEE